MRATFIVIFSNELMITPQNVQIYFENLAGSAAKFLKFV